VSSSPNTLLRARASNKAKQYLVDKYRAEYFAEYVKACHELGLSRVTSAKRPSTPTVTLCDKCEAETYNSEVMV